MKQVILLALLSFAAAASAQPTEPPTAGGLWERLTPEQQAMLWHSLTPEQKADLWRNLPGDQRRGMRDRSTPLEPDRAIRPGPHRGFDRGARMTPEERERMREQIREAYRLRRERMEAERQARRGRE
jgi:Spy/CpxP family protein refolding chaperone